MTTWVLESGAFKPAYGAFCHAVHRLGHRRITWDDDWWDGGSLPDLAGDPIIFHGSLGNADRIVRELPWSPGAFCATSQFYCSRWYEKASKWLLHHDWRTTTVAELALAPIEVVGSLARDGMVFVRPDSPLKPFSGRVCSVDEITLEALDFGFYYEDKETPVVIAPVRAVGRESRFVIVDGEVIAGSGYVANGRVALDSSDTGPWTFAGEVARSFEAPERVYVLDICESAGDLHLVEINPFSGADLYACDPERVVVAVSAVVDEQARLRDGT